MCLPLAQWAQQYQQLPIWSLGDLIEGYGRGTADVFEVGRSPVGTARLQP